MKLEELKNKKIIILGYGIEGKSVYEYLTQHYPQQEIAITDKKNGEDYLNKQKGYDVAIKSPGIHKSNVIIPYTTATNIFFANVKGMTIGVTGSKGKSTTSSLIYSIVKQGMKDALRLPSYHAGKKVHLVGNITHTLDPIGTPMLTELLKSNEADDIWVCELSSFQLDDIRYSPHISVITSFFPEHMDYHGSVEKYFSAKKNILQYAKPTDYFIYNPKFEALQKLARETKAKAIPYNNSLPFTLYPLPLPGEHNVDNVKAAVTVAELLKIPDQIIDESIKNFKPLPHRLEKVGTFRGITFYDDAIATTPEATIQAIQTVKNIGTIFLGGQDRGYDFAKLAEIIVLYKIPNIVLFPDSGEKIEKELRIMNYELRKNEKSKINIFKTSSMEDAVRFAYENTKPGAIALLSTASPSYSVWKNFEEKGNLFKKYAKIFSH